MTTEERYPYLWFYGLLCLTLILHVALIFLDALVWKKIKNIKNRNELKGKYAKKKITHIQSNYVIEKQKMKTIMYIRI